MDTIIDAVEAWFTTNVPLMLAAMAAIITITLAVKLAPKVVSKVLSAFGR